MVVVVVLEVTQPRLVRAISSYDLALHLANTRTGLVFTHIHICFRLGLPWLPVDQLHTDPAHNQMYFQIYQCYFNTKKLSPNYYCS